MMKKLLRGFLVVSVAAPFFVASACHAADNVLNGCYQKNKGQLRVLAKKDRCLRSEVAVSWNKIGPQGPIGLAGPQGPTGPVGPQGPAGVLGFYTVTTAFTVDAAGNADLSSACLAGDQVTGGGFSVPPLAGVKLVASFPAEGDLTETPPVSPSWHVSVDNAEADPWEGSVYAVCADLP